MVRCHYWSVLSDINRAIAIVLISCAHKLWNCALQMFYFTIHAGKRGLPYDSDVTLNACKVRLMCGIIYGRGSCPDVIPTYASDIIVLKKHSITKKNNHFAQKGGCRPKKQNLTIQK